MSKYKWDTVNGKEWKLTVGDMTAIVNLRGDEKTYATIIWINGEWSGSVYDCIEKAKAACIEAIEVATTISMGVENESA